MWIKKFICAKLKYKNLQSIHIFFSHYKPLAEHCCDNVREYCSTLIRHYGSCWLCFFYLNSPGHFYPCKRFYLVHNANKSIYKCIKTGTFDSGHIVIGRLVHFISNNPVDKMKIDGNIRKRNQKKVQPDYCFHFKLFNRVSLWCTLFWPLNTFQPTFFVRRRAIT